MRCAPRLLNSEFKPQLPAMMSGLPSASTSAVVTNVHKPVGQSKFVSVSLPLLFEKTRTFDHSMLRMSSGKPSELRSENIAPVTKPMSRNGSEAFSSRAKVLPSYRKKKLEAARGYSPGMQRPPTNNWSELSPAMSVRASELIMTLGTEIV